MRVAQAPPQQLVRGKMPELDALRGVAILAVLFYHGFAWSSDPASFPRWQRLAVLATTAGWLGVNLFFVLSGFLITGILLDTRRDLHYYRNFYLRRALRILPLYYVVLAVLLVTGIGGAAYVALSAIYLANLTWIVGVGADYQVLWSLAVEEHFYFLLARPGTVAVGKTNGGHVCWHCRPHAARANGSCSLRIAGEKHNVGRTGRARLRCIHRGGTAFSRLGPSPVRVVVRRAGGAWDRRPACRNTFWDYHAQDLGGERLAGDAFQSCLRRHALSHTAVRHFAMGAICGSKHPAFFRGHQLLPVPGASSRVYRV